MNTTKTYLVIGASSSIGLALLEACSKEGISVIGTWAHTNPQPMPGVQWEMLDLTDATSFQPFCSKLPTVDVVVLLSGVLPGKKLQDYGAEEIEQTMNINFTSQARLLHELIPHLADNSQIICMSSIAGQQGSYDPIYAASKSAFIGLTKSLAKTLAPKTRVNAIAPGLVAGSTMEKSFSSETRERHISQTPIKKFVQKEELAAVILDITKDHWGSLNGTVIDLNGGRY